MRFYCILLSKIIVKIIQWLYFSKCCSEVLLAEQTIITHKFVLVFRLFWWRSAGLQHFLHYVESYSGLGFVFRNGKDVQQVVVSHVRAARVTMLIYHPFELCRIGVTRSYVLGLQMLQLTVYIVSFAHFRYSFHKMLPGRNVCMFSASIENDVWTPVQ